jgi:hypothetical protein
MTHARLPLRAVGEVVSRVHFRSRNWREDILMLVVLQFPIADLRSFLDAEDTRVEAAKGGWIPVDLQHYSDVNKRKYPFIRNMGPIRTRRQGLRISGENLYFRGKKGLRFASGLSSIPDPRHPPGLSLIPDPRIELQVMFRRFQPYSDIQSGGNSNQISKYEMALMLDVARSGHPPLTPVQLNHVIRSCLALLVTSAQFDAPEKEGHRRCQVKLIEAGAKIARQLRWSTSAKPHTATALPEDWTIQARTPVLLVEFGSNEVSGTPAADYPVTFKNCPELTLFHSVETASGHVFECWYLRSSPTQIASIKSGGVFGLDYPQVARNLRVAILRQHAEREVLDYVLRCLKEPGMLTLYDGGEHDPSFPTTPARLQLLRYLLGSRALMRRRGRSNRRLPFSGAPDGMNVPGRVVDELNPVREDRITELLTVILGVELMEKINSITKNSSIDAPGVRAKVKSLMMPRGLRPLNIAVSYAHAAPDSLSEFKNATHIDALTGAIKRWDDCCITPSSEFGQDILKAFKNADVIVLLLSPAFLESKYCMNIEVPLALKQHEAGKAVVLPVVAIDCEWEATDLAKLQGVMYHGKPIYSIGNNQQAAWNSVRHAMYTAAIEKFTKHSQTPSATVL